MPTVRMVKTEKLAWIVGIVFMTLAHVFLMDLMIMIGEGLAAAGPEEEA